MDIKLKIENFMDDYMALIEYNGVEPFKISTASKETREFANLYTRSFALVMKNADKYSFINSSRSRVDTLVARSSNDAYLYGVRGVDNIFLLVRDVFAKCIELTIPMTVRLEFPDGEVIRFITKDGNTYSEANIDDFYLAKDKVLSLKKVEV